jgi:Tol biopolymer transport system component
VPTATPVPAIDLTQLAGTLVLVSSRNNPNSHLYAHTQIYTMRPDATNAVKITQPSALTPEGDTIEHRYPAWSPDKSKIVFVHQITDSDAQGKRSSIMIINADGSQSTEIISSTTARYDYPEWSSDGQFILAQRVANDNSRSDIVKIQLNPFSQQVLTADTTGSYWPSFSPDGQTIVFSSDRSGKSQIWRMNADGSNPVQLTNKNTFPYYSLPQWRSDGQKIMFQQNTALYQMNPDGSAVELLKDECALARISPDNRWLLCQTTGFVYVKDTQSNAEVKIPTDTTIAPFGSDDSPDWR